MIAGKRFCGWHQIEVMPGWLSSINWKSHKDQNNQIEVIIKSSTTKWYINTYNDFKKLPFNNVLRDNGNFLFTFDNLCEWGYQYKI
jgi:hypothetical protein